MTKRFAVLAVLILTGSAAYAQDAAISVFTTNVRGGWTSNQGSTYDADYGIGVEHWFSPRVSAAVNVSRHRDVTEVYDLNGVPSITRFYDYEYPIDALLRYRFRGNERWKPYLGGGLRGDRAFDRHGARVWSVDPEVNGGVTFLITKKLGLDFDGKYVLDQSHYTGVDQFRVSLGLSWRF